jgi:hypothetical protein
MTEQSPLIQPSASDFVGLALAQIPSAFGRLAFVAGLKHPNPGRYDDPLAALVFGKDQIDAVLRRKHWEIFSAWLSVALATQSGEVAEYLAGQAHGQKTRIEQTLQVWIQYELYANLIPETASEQERELFSSDVKAILQLLQVRLQAKGAQGS